MTSRLHVALPCLAMGTPVVLSAEDRRRVEQPARLSLLDDLGFRYGEPNVIDVGPIARRYRRFLTDALAVELQDADEPLPPVEAFP